MASRKEREGRSKAQWAVAKIAKARTSDEVEGVVKWAEREVGFDFRAPVIAAASARRDAIRVLEAVGGEESEIAGAR